MKYTLLVTVFLGLWICKLESRKLPSFIKKCKRDYPEINTCVKNAMLNFKKYLPKGVKELSLVPMEPYEMERSRVKASWMTIIASKIKLYNAYDFEVDYLDIDLDRNTIKLNLTQKYMELTCHYHLEGQLLQLALQGDGEVESNFTDTKSASIITGTRVTKKGKEYLRLDDIDFKLRRDSLEYFYFHNLFENNPALTERVNELFQESRGDLTAELMPLIESVISKIYLSFFKNVFDRFSLQELFI